jgi:5-formyltetrahydrofolate cyclo-ligase
MENKNMMRSEYSGKRLALSPEYVNAASARICSHLSLFAPLRGSDAFAAFFPTKGEPDILPFLKSEFAVGRRVFFPRYSRESDCYLMTEASVPPDSFTAGKFGIPEPPGTALPDSGLPPDMPWIVPGLAFDSRGHRLGHGNGVYDRLMSNAGGVKTGICFKNQMAESVPSDENDRKVDFVITEEGVRQC